jgi:hypothetical protein
MRTSNGQALNQWCGSALVLIRIRIQHFKSMRILFRVTFLWPSKTRKILQLGKTLFLFNKYWNLFIPRLQHFKAENFFYFFRHFALLDPVPEPHFQCRSRTGFQPANTNANPCGDPDPQQSPQQTWRSRHTGTGTPYGMSCKHVPEARGVTSAVRIHSSLFRYPAGKQTCRFLPRYSCILSETVPNQ